MVVPTLPLLLAFDLDGTLIPDQGGALDADTVQALRTLQGMGVKLAIITGRDEVPSAVLEAVAFDATAPNNGGAIRIQGELRHEALLGEADVAAALAHDLPGAQTVVVTRTGPFLAWPAEAEVPVQVQAWLDRHQVPLLTGAAQRTAFKVRLSHPDAARFAASLRESHPHLVVTGGCEPYLSTVCVTPAEADKAIALARIAQALGISLERTVAFGDSDNDVTLLRAAGHAVQVGAQPYLSGVADERIDKQAELGQYLLDLARRLSEQATPPLPAPAPA